MDSKSLRDLFIDFFVSKGHKSVASAPIVVKDDPTLMFTNAGMNQFKGIFLGEETSRHDRVVNSQKCLRVSGKHNDLEEVGYDGFHHTMFEMLGNWSFGNYFKEEAIALAWEFLIDVCKLDKNRIYVTVFEGDKKEGLIKDKESSVLWEKYMPVDRIINATRKDNFWEMGEIGPCGPCTEIHYDNRPDSERSKKDGKDLINKNNPNVIEIWNIVFICYNRLFNGKLEDLPEKHVDTGMGLERICMITQSVQSTYDTDIFQSIIYEISKISQKKYGASKKSDIAMRVVSDHLRAIVFSIADGQLPSNTKAGYVIRRILRRAVRYGYSFLDMKKPFIYNLVPVLASQLGYQFSEIETQKELIEKVIKEEEESFLRTLAGGLKRINEITQSKKAKEVSGKLVFELYDTFGFPSDLTALILNERGMRYNQKEFDNEMKKQKERSKGASKIEKGDWVIVHKDNKQEFIGYDTLETSIKIVRYRQINTQSDSFYQLIFNLTPFYPEGGGQVGDKGTLISNKKEIEILNTIKENNIIIHLVKALPKDVKSDFIARVNYENRKSSSSNHTATHLLHQSLRDILGEHIEQKGSLVCPKYLRFDFSHFVKIEQEELESIEDKVNEKIIENIKRERHDLPLTKAKEMNAIMLFGEKYDDVVRVIQFGESKELCGGTHVEYTGEIGLFKILSEGSISSGIRRIEAITGKEAFNYFNKKASTLKDIEQLVKDKDVVKAVKVLLNDNKRKDKIINDFTKANLISLEKELLEGVIKINGIQLITKKVNLDSKEMKTISFGLKNQKNLIACLASCKEDKVVFTVFLTDDLVKKGKNALELISEVSKHINGSGGGQSFFATAGGTNIQGVNLAFKAIQRMIDK